MKLRILFLICYISSFSQEEKELFFYDQCGKTTVQSEFLISEKHKLNFNKKSEKFKFKFEKNKRYLIQPLRYNPLKNYFFYEDNSKNQKDTLLISNIYLDTHKPEVIENPKFYNCGILCNGEIASYYPNEKIEKIERIGIYDNGELLLEKYYHQNGDINFENKYLKNHYGFFIKHTEYNNTIKNVFYSKEKSSNFIYRKKINDIKIEKDSITLSDIRKFSPNGNINYWGKSIKKNITLKNTKCFYLQRDTLRVFVGSFKGATKLCFDNRYKMHLEGPSRNHCYGPSTVIGKGIYIKIGNNFIFKRNSLPFFDFGRTASYLWKEDEGIFVKIK